MSLILQFGFRYELHVEITKASGVIGLKTFALFIEIKWNFTQISGIKLGCIQDFNSSLLTLYLYEI